MKKRSFVRKTQCAHTTVYLIDFIEFTDKYGVQWWKKIILSLYPVLKIRPRWRDEWDQVDRKSFVTGVRVTNVFAGLAYVAHIVYVDAIYNLQPRRDWVALRGVGIAINVVCFICTYIPRVNEGKIYWLPMAFVGIVCTYLQDVSFRWYPPTPYMFSIVLPLIAGAVMRLSVPNTIFYMLVCYSTVINCWIARGNELANIISFAVVAVMFACALRGRQSSDIDAFIAEQENLETQKKLIEREMELNQQIKAFLPREIYRRFLGLVQGNRKPNDAMDELLRCKEKTVSCIYTDIRGFTQKTKVIDNFVANSAIPNIKTCTDIIEKHAGIPKLVGDLVFAYFDDESKTSFARTVLCALDLAEANEQMNARMPQNQNVQRYILVSLGRAVVGNIGGSEGARDINVLGTPANVLSRLDPLTKYQQFRDSIGNETIILTDAAGDYLKQSIPRIEIHEVNVKDLNLTVRDFEEIQKVYCLKATSSNRSLLASQLGEMNQEEETVELPLHGAIA